MKHVKSKIKGSRRKVILINNTDILLVEKLVGIKAVSPTEEDTKQVAYLEAENRSISLSLSPKPPQLFG